MTWPTVPIVTTAMDAGTDTPPRDQIKAMADAINDMIATPPAAGVGRLLGVQKFLTAGSFTYTPTAGATRLVIEIRGGGGSGAGALSTSASEVSYGGAGGAGGYGVFLVDVDFGSAAVVVGAGGAAAAAAAAGNDGGFSQITLGTTGRLLSATGGYKGAVGSRVTSFPWEDNSFGSGALPPSLTMPLAGDFQICAHRGGGGWSTATFSAAFHCVGNGGVPYGFPTPGPNYLTSGHGAGNYVDAAGSGAGGPAYVNGNSGASRANPYPGLGGSLVIWEYS